MSNVFIYDVETLTNCFTYSAIDVETDDVVSFVIWEGRNDIQELLNHLDNCNGQIGFNNIAFDANIIELILKNRNKFLKIKGDQIAKLIYKEAQFTIEKEWSDVRYPSIMQLDLFRIWHFDNRAKMVSLKALEIAMGFENVQDMPYDHKTTIRTQEQVDQILAYNLNDVIATKKFYEKSINKIELRKELIKEYDLPCLNYSDSKIGEELALKLYCDFTKQDTNAIKKRRTHRKSFKFKDCIPDYIKFETVEFNGLLDYLKSIEVTELKDSFHYEFEYNGGLFYYGIGGLHQSAKEGIYQSDENIVITDFDVAGLYPNLIINNDIFPQHLGIEFCDLFSEMVKKRSEAKKAGNKNIADSLKLANNSCFGKFNSEYSWLFDSLATVKTTLAGQLSLSMLIEKLYLNIPDLKMIQSNTDGATGLYDKKYKRLFWEICKEWEKTTNLELEYVAYDKMVLRDVNNYLAVDIKGKVKRKGIFKLHDEMREDGEWQKGFNNSIVVDALSNYYLRDIAPEETIYNCKDIYAFCKKFSLRGNFICETLDIDDENIEYNREQQQKTVRYFISKTGKKFRKVGKPLKPKWNKFVPIISELEYVEINKIKTKINDQISELISIGVVETREQVRAVIQCPPKLYTLLNKYYKNLSYIFEISSVDTKRSETEESQVECKMDWRIIDIESEGLVTIFNQYYEVPFEEYNIDYDYYLNQCYLIINTINHKTERRREEEKNKKEDQKIEKERIKYIEGCINVQCTRRNYDILRKEWMNGVFPPITVFKPSPKRKGTESTASDETLFASGNTLTINN